MARLTDYRRSRPTADVTIGFGRLPDRGRLCPHLGARIRRHRDRCRTGRRSRRRAARRRVAASSVAIVERDLVGGECSFYACMPSKALLRPAEVLAEARRVPGRGRGGHRRARRAGGARPPRRGDPRPRRLRAAAVARGSRDRRCSAGSARLDGERRVVVGDDVLIAREAVILATGSTAAMPPIPGLAEAGAWSNRQITTAKEVPARLLILGGGVVGVEMAQAWASLGSKVTIIEARTCAARQRGAVRRGAGRRGAARRLAPTCGSAPKRCRSVAAAMRSRSSSRTARRSSATGCWSRSGASR